VNADTFNDFRFLHIGWLLLFFLIERANLGAVHGGVKHFSRWFCSRFPLSWAVIPPKEKPLALKWMPAVRLPARYPNRAESITDGPTGVWLAVPTANWNTHSRAPPANGRFADPKISPSMCKLPRALEMSGNGSVWSAGLQTGAFRHSTNAPVWRPALQTEPLPNFRAGNSGSLRPGRRPLARPVRNLFDVFPDLIDLRMQFFDQFMFFFGKAFDSLALFPKLFQHRILLFRDAVHPPETNGPAGKAQQSQPECNSQILHARERTMK